MEMNRTTVIPTLEGNGKGTTPCNIKSSRQIKC